jgi:predicted metal-dependent hydrolase
VKRKITIDGKDLDYALRRRKGNRCLKLSAYPDGYLVVSAPARYPIFLINSWLKRNVDWIKRRMPLDITEKIRDDRKEYESKKDEIRNWLAESLDILNRAYGFRYERISVRRVRTRWGSCSARKNLNFNYKIYFLEKDLQDYVMIHELCHLEELNHSRKFWELVARTIPDFREKRKKLRKVKI